MSPKPYISNMKEDGVTAASKVRLPISPTSWGHDVRPHHRGAPLQVGPGPSKAAPTPYTVN